MLNLIARAAQPQKPSSHAAVFFPEVLESRALMSAAPFAGACPMPPTTVTTVTTASAAKASAAPASKFAAVTGTYSTVAFSTLSDTLKAALSALSQGVTIDAAQQVKVLTKSSGSSVYSAIINVNGVASRIAVDGSGNALEGVVQFSAAPAAVQTGLLALYTTGTIPATQTVQIRPGRNDATLYSTTVTVNGVATPITVDATGAAVSFDQRNCGTQTTVAFGTLSDAVKTALSSLAQGVTIADAQQVQSLTKADGTVIYSAVLSVNGVPNRIAVDGTGKLLEGTIALSAAPAAVKTALAALVTADTTPSTLPDSQLVRLSTRHDGVTVYSTTVTVSGTTTTLAVDATGAAVTVAKPTGGGRHGRR